MADNPPVSIVVTTVNRLEYLKRALRSLEHQTYRQFEVIVLDDGSSDGTVEFLSGFRPWFAFQWLKFSSRERSFLRNEGVAAARGELIAFLDDDDEWHAEKLTRQVAFMRDQPSIQLSYCLTVPIDTDGNVMEDLDRAHRRTYERHFRTGHTYTALVSSCLIFTSSVMVTKNSFLSVGGFDESLVGAEDWDFYLRFARNHVIGALPEPLVRYRVHPGNSASSDDRLRQIRVADARIRAATMHIANTAGLNRIDRAHLLNTISQNHYWAGRPGEAMRYAFAAIAMRPALGLVPDNVSRLAKSAVKALR